MAQIYWWLLCTGFRDNLQLVKSLTTYGWERLWWDRPFARQASVLLLSLAICRCPPLPKEVPMSQLSLVSSRLANSSTLAVLEPNAHHNYSAAECGTRVDGVGISSLFLITASSARDGSYRGRRGSRLR